MTELDTQFPAW